MTYRIQDPLFLETEEASALIETQVVRDDRSTANASSSLDGKTHRRRLLGHATAQRLEQLAQKTVKARAIGKPPTTPHDKARIPKLALVARRPSSKAATQIHKIRAELLARCSADADPALSVVAVYDARVSEYLAVNLAASFAMLKRPTLLIDAHTRRNSIAKLFSMEPSGSLVKALEGDACPLSSCNATAIENLYVLSAAEYRSKQDELYSADGLKRVFATLANEYAHLVIHAPPALKFASSRFVLAAASQTLVAVHRDNDRMKDLSDLHDLLRTSGARAIGSVLTK